MQTMQEHPAHAVIGKKNKSMTRQPKADYFLLTARMSCIVVFFYISADLSSWHVQRFYLSLLISVYPPFPLHSFCRCPSHPLLTRYLYPRQLLIRHFWTPQQLVEFQGLYHAQRAQHHQPLLGGLKTSGSRIAHEQLKSRLTELCSKVSLSTRRNTLD